MMFKKTLLAAAVLGLAAVAADASAATSASFQVTATVIKSCAISTSPIAFGNYDPTSGTTVSAQGSVSAKCTKGTPVTVALDQGLHQATGSTGAIPARQMISGANLLPYNIYTTSGGTTEWGNTTTSEPATQTSASVNTALVFTTYGSLPVGADVPVGSYADTVTASLVF